MSTATGAKLFFSYAACGSTDTYTADKCSAFMTSTPCDAQDECVWAANVCVVDNTNLARQRSAASCLTLMGNSDCPCTGSNGQPKTVVGSDTVVITSQEGFSGHRYPGNYGEHCSAHAEPGISSCQGNYPAGWCTSPWCYVDPCACSDPSIGSSDHFVTTLSGKPLYYSYASCRSPDRYNTDKCTAFSTKVTCEAYSECTFAMNMCHRKTENLKAALVDSKCATQRNRKCPCSGTNGQQHSGPNGGVMANVRGVAVEYPADYGELCYDHADPGDLSCTGPSPAPHCGHQWCYVDPCFCDGPTDIAESDYFGTKLFYSYQACVATDEHHAVKCETMDEAACMADDSCTFANSSCAANMKNVAASRALMNCDALNFGAFGTACRCTGNNLQERVDRNGIAKVYSLKSGLVEEYRSDYGQSCKVHPEPGDTACTGDAPAAWCSSPWCYVDPCECAVDASLFESAHFASTVTGAKLFYSFAACGPEDAYNVDKCGAITAQKPCDAEDECMWVTGVCRVDTANLLTQRSTAGCSNLVGNSNCGCTGTNGQAKVSHGADTVVVTTMEGFSGHIYPGSYGEHCAAHAEPANSSCQGNYPADWCTTPWCYVDPCECSDVAIRKSDYFATTLSGKPVYYSYASCGSPETYNADKCIRIYSQDLCVAEDECTFTRAGCKRKADDLNSARTNVGCNTESSTTYAIHTISDTTSICRVMCSTTSSITIAAAVLLSSPR